MEPIQNNSVPIATPAPPPTPPQPAPPAVNGKLHSWLMPIIIFLAVCLLIAISAAIWIFLSSKKNVPQKQTNTPAAARVAATISGNVAFEGYAPQGAYLVIAERGEKEKDFKSVVTGLAPQTGNIPWSWNDASSGKNYEIKAQLKVSGIVVQESTVSTVSAPGSDVNLGIVSEQDPPQPQSSQINGGVNINGYIPTGATVVITAQAQSQTNVQSIVPALPAVDDTNWSWSGAVLGTTYILSAQLMNAGSQISSPVYITVTAPTSGIIFDLNSTAQPPAPTITGLSGTININGNLPSNPYITIGTRVSGTTSFNQIGGNMAAVDNATWTWNTAQSGTSYDVQAYLWSNNTPYAQSQILTVTAPSNGDFLTINAQQSFAPPNSGTINVACGPQQNGTFQATINYNTLGNLYNPASFNIIVTLAAQGTQVLNTTVSPPNPGQPQSLTTTYTFTSGATYYAQYSYSTQQSGSFTSLSPAVQFSCW